MTYLHPLGAEPLKGEHYQLMHGVRHTLLARCGKDHVQVLQTTAFLVPVFPWLQNLAATYA